MSLDADITATARRLAPLPRDADDLAQIGRLAAWKARLSDAPDLAGWMRVKARWAMIEHLRNHGPYARDGRPRFALSLDAMEYDIPDPGNLEDTVCDRAEVEAFRDWLNSLPERTAEAVVLIPAEWAAKYGRDGSRACQIRREALDARCA
jgi:DNA-directed RNA polymerase specialized sigma24 family protein